METGLSPPYTYWFRLMGVLSSPNSTSWVVNRPWDGSYSRVPMSTNAVSGSVGWDWKEKGVDEAFPVRVRLSPNGP